MTYFRTRYLGPLRNHSGDIPEHITYKPGNERQRLPDLISFSSGCLSESDYTKLSPRWCLRHGDRGSRRNHLLLPLKVLRQAEENPLCNSTGISQWKHPATIKANQILLALHQLAKNTISANFEIEFHQIYKSLTRTMPTFDRKSEKFELFEDLFQIKLKLHNQLTEDNRNQLFPSSREGRCTVDI